MHHQSKSIPKLHPQKRVEFHLALMEQSNSWQQHTVGGKVKVLLAENADVSATSPAQEKL